MCPAKKTNRTRGPARRVRGEASQPLLRAALGMAFRRVPYSWRICIRPAYRDIAFSCSIKRTLKSKRGSWVSLSTQSISGELDIFTDAGGHGGGGPWGCPSGLWVSGMSCLTLSLPRAFAFSQPLCPQGLCYGWSLSPCLTSGLPWGPTLQADLSFCLPEMTLPPPGPSDPARGLGLKLPSLLCFELCSS